MNKTIEFTKVRDVKTPNRANKHDAGTDFFVPNYTSDFLGTMIEKNYSNNIKFELTENGCDFIIPPGEKVIIPSGIKVNILDKSTYLEAKNKSGIATKYGLILGACVVDSDYQGEIIIVLHNISDNNSRISTGQKIVQFIHKHYIDTDWQEIPIEYYNNLSKSDRGDGGFGSTTEK